MLKIRLMGTKNDIKWFEKILKRQPKVAVTEVSEMYRNKGTNRYYRAYVEVHKHRASDPYHTHSRSRSLNRAIRDIKSHDQFQLNGRKPIRKR